MIAISNALNDFRLNAVIAFLAVGAENARAELYDGARPPLGGTPIGKRLVSIVLMEPLGTVSDLRENILGLTGPRDIPSDQEEDSQDHEQRVSPMPQLS